MVKKALLVGINKYSDSPLRGCINDVIVIFQILTSKFGFKTEDIKILTDLEATRKNIVEGLKWLTQGVTSGDQIVFHYSGHGSQVMVDDWTSSGEVDGRDEILCNVDLDWNNPIRDHEVGAYFKRVPKDCDTLVILDCCLAAETKIPLLDGTVKTIKELSDVEGEYWVYANDGNGNIVPGKAHSARVTGYKELIKITLDNGEVLECTEDHKIMLKNGKYKEAGKLTIEDSLMPLYRRVSDKIIKIESTGKKEAVYDMTVNEFHNFAIDAGIFVHNCHSGTGLRNGFVPGKERTNTDYVNRFISPPLSNILSNPSLIIKDDLSFDFPDHKVDCRAEKSKFLIETSEQGDAILISGCEDNQTSADAWINNKYQGAMTYTLAHVLSLNNFDITYRQLIKTMNKKMDQFKFTQNPQLECSPEFFNTKFLQ